MTIELNGDTVEAELFRDNPDEWRAVATIGEYEYEGTGGTPSEAIDELLEAVADGQDDDDEPDAEDEDDDRPRRGRRTKGDDDDRGR